MAQIDLTYSEILSEILNFGHKYEDPNRKGVVRQQIPHFLLEHSVSESFPALTLKKLYWKGVVGELLWFLSGDTSIDYLHENGIHFRDKDYERWQKSPNYHGDLGRIYGAQWREFRVGRNWVDQIRTLIDNLINRPFATDHIVTAWNPAERHNMALDPCHFMFQIMVYPIEHEDFEHGFDLIWSQRSVDVFLGASLNIASYALLMEIIGKIVGMKPMYLRGDLRNVHLYDNSIEASKELLKRDWAQYRAPKLKINADPAIFELMRTHFDDGLEQLKIEDFVLEDYESYPNLKVEMLTRDK